MEEIVIAPATASDVATINRILEENALPIDGVDDHWRTFLVAKDGQNIIGCAGAETYRVAALLRSVAVRPEYRRHGVGRQLVRQMLDRLSARGLREFYLLTTTAAEYFGKRGFKRIERDEVHPQVLASREFQDACPSTAVCMRLVMMS